MFSDHRLLVARIVCMWCNVYWSQTTSRQNCFYVMQCLVITDYYSPELFVCDAMFSDHRLLVARIVNYDDSEEGIGILVSYRFRYGAEVGFTRACTQTGYIFSLHSISRLSTQHHSVYRFPTQVKSHPSPRFRAVVHPHHDFPHHTALAITRESKKNLTNKATTTYHAYRYSTFHAY